MGLCVVDEDTWPAIIPEIEALGYEVVRSVDVVGRSAVDWDVLRYTDENEALLVTRNKRDFQRMFARRKPKGESRRTFRWASALYFRCENSAIVRRFTAVRDIIEHEILASKDRPDGRIFIAVGNDQCCIYR